MLAQGVCRDETMWPGAWIADQSSAHGIHEDIIRFVADGFFLPQPMIEEIVLPMEVAYPGGPAFEVEDSLPHGMVWIGKTEQGMHMIWHDKENADKPDTVLMTVNGGIADFCGPIVFQKFP